MQRIMVIGNCGAGKSTFSNRLSELVGLEIIHLDQYYYRPNWSGINSADWEKMIIELSSKSHWIMDGNYGGTIDIRINNADTIIFLDYSSVIC